MRPRLAAPRRLKRELRSRSLLVATRCRSVSVSEVDEKMAPCFCNALCTVMALVRFAIVGDGEAAIGEFGEDRAGCCAAGAAGVA